MLPNSLGENCHLPAGPAYLLTSVRIRFVWDPGPWYDQREANLPLARVASGCRLAGQFAFRDKGDLSIFFTTLGSAFQRRQRASIDMP
jgi:hypothetical protein